LCVILSELKGEPVSIADALTWAVDNALACLGDGENVATFDVDALKEIMSRRTAAMTRAVIEAVTVSTAEFLEKIGHPAPVQIEMTEDGKRIAASVGAFTEPPPQRIEA